MSDFLTAHLQKGDCFLRVVIFLELAVVSANKF